MTRAEPTAKTVVPQWSGRRGQKDCCTSMTRAEGKEKTVAPQWLRPRGRKRWSYLNDEGGGDGKDGSTSMTKTKGTKKMVVPQWRGRRRQQRRRVSRASALWASPPSPWSPPPSCCSRTFQSSSVPPYTSIQELQEQRYFLLSPTLLSILLMY